MAMNIKNDEAHELAKELASLEHTTVTDAVVISLREAVARRRAETAAANRLAKVRELVDRFTEVDRTIEGPTLWEINEDLYDDMGLPR